MKNILALIGLVFVIFVGAGWYLGWYKFESATTTKDGKTNVSVEVNASKIGKDAKSFHERIAHMIDTVQDEAQDAKEAKKEESKKPSVEEKKQAVNPFGVKLPAGN